jgi:hypothetical protein
MGQPSPRPPLMYIFRLLDDTGCAHFIYNTDDTGCAHLIYSTNSDLCCKKTFRQSRARTKQYTTDLIRCCVLLKNPDRRSFDPHLLLLAGLRHSRSLCLTTPPSNTNYGTLELLTEHPVTAAPSSTLFKMLLPVHFLAIPIS